VSLIISKSLIFIQGKLPAAHGIDIPARQAAFCTVYCGFFGWKRTIASPAAVVFGAGRKAWP
jgi:hypothetical protein